MGGSTSYLKCPYCSEWVQGGHGKKIPKTVGHYKVKIIDNSNILIFRCERCVRVFRVRMAGCILKWDDMTQQERNVFSTRYDFKTETMPSELDIENGD